MHWSQVPLVLVVMFRRSPSIAMIMVPLAVGLTLVGKVRALLRRLHRGTAEPIKAKMGQRFLIGDPD